MKKEAHPKSPEVLDEEASRYEAYFWQHVADDETLAKLDNYEKRIMVEASLWTNMGNPDVKAPPTIQEKLGYHEFVGWRPKSAGEAFTASHHGYARKSVNAIKALWENARSDLDVLKVGVNSQGINLERIRADYDILYVLGDNLMSREFFASGRWPDKRRREEKQEYVARQQYWRGFMVAAAKFAGDNTLRDFYKQVLDEATACDRYWSAEFNLVPTHPAGRVAIAGAIESAGNESENQPTDYETMIPADIKKELDARKKAYEELWEQLDNQGMPEWRKKEILWERFPEFRPAEAVETEELNEIRRRRAAAEPVSKKKRINLGPLGKMIADEPPPGIEDSRRYRF